MIVEPAAGDTVADNLNPVGRVYYSFTAFLCVPNALSQEGGYALGAQAGEVPVRRLAARRRVHPLPRGSPRPRSTSCTPPGREPATRAAVAAARVASGQDPVRRRSGSRRS